RRSGYSGGSGSFTFRIRSAACQTRAASDTSVAPAARYSASEKPAVSPAPFWICTFAPSETQRRQRLGVIETRVSPILISLGTPMVMRGENHENRERHEKNASLPGLAASASEWIVDVLAFKWSDVATSVSEWMRRPLHS